MTRYYPFVIAMMIRKSMHNENTKLIYKERDEGKLKWNIRNKGRRGKNKEEFIH